MKVLVLGAALAATASWAQTAPPPAATASSPAFAAGLRYRSTFEGYQRFEEEKVHPWKDTNDQVGRIGGWREYARQAREPAATGTTTPPASATHPHAGHGKP